MKRLDGKVALITGGAAGLGRDAAELFLSQGAKVVIVDLNRDELEKTAHDLKGGENLISVVADVSKEEDVKKYVQSTISKFGKIDVFYNNAGIEGKVTSVMDQKVEDFDRVISVNVRGVFLGMKYVLPEMVKQKSGSVINMSSVAGLSGFANMSPYVASKHAVVGMTKCAALEMAPFNVRVNSVHPTAINTRMMRSLEEGFAPGAALQAKANLEKTIPLGRYGEPRDVSNVVLFLASDESAFLTGVQYRIDGGQGAQ